MPPLLRAAGLGDRRLLPGSDTTKGGKAYAFVLGGGERSMYFVDLSVRSLAESSNQSLLVQHRACQTENKTQSWPSSLCVNKKYKKRSFYGKEHISFSLSKQEGGERRVPYMGLL